MPAQSTTAEPAKPLRRSTFAGRVLRKFLLLLIISMTGLSAISFTSQSPDHLGVIEGRLSNCPDSPNCVSTQVQSEENRINPIPFSSVNAISSDQPLSQIAIKRTVLQQIKEVVKQNFSRVKLVEEKEDYLHFEFKSLIFRFVDDVEFYLDDASQQIHFRSASRVGYSDLGVNRKRMNKITQELKK